MYFYLYCSIFVVIATLPTICNRIRRKLINNKANDVLLTTTGDILYFSSPNFKVETDLLNFVSQDIFFHVGIVVYTPRPMFLHFINPNDASFFKSDHNGPLILSVLDDVLKCYPTRTLICKLSPPIGKLNTTEIIFKSKEIVKGKDYDQHYILSFLTSNNTKLNCLTFLGKLMESLGILNESRNPVHTYIPGKLKRDLVNNGFKESFHRINLAF